MDGGLSPLDSFRADRMPTTEGLVQEGVIGVGAKWKGLGPPDRGMMLSNGELQ